MGLKSKIFVFLFTFSSLFSITNVLADWQGPVEVVKGNWGSGENEFKFSKMKYIDVMPYHFTVMPDGKVVVVSGTYKVFNSDGSFVKTLEISSERAHAIDEDTILVFGIEPDVVKGQRVFLYNIVTEKVEWIDMDNETSLSDPLMDYEVSVSEDMSKFVVRRSKSSGIEYSSAGGVLSKLSENPLFFGQLKKRGSVGDGKYYQVIEFEDVKYGCVTPTPFSRFRRDSKGYLYGISRTSQGGGLHTRIYKITKCGKIVGTVDFPADKETFFKEDEARLDEAYGQPVFAPNGDVYTWKRTPTHYSILKWPWQDDPNVNDGPDAPVEPQALPSTSGVYLTWSASPQDPGCVTGYDVERATSATGIYTKVSTVPLDEEQKYKFNDTTASAGQTWHYRIKATSEIGDSDPVGANAARP